jgi:hypothetical protein
MTCKGICIRHKAQKPVGSGRYATGQKRCQICEIFIKWDGLWCPCCGYRLRTKPRNLKYKAKLRARETIKSTRIPIVAVTSTTKPNTLITLNTLPSHENTHGQNRDDKYVYGLLISRTFLKDSRLELLM